MSSQVTAPASLAKVEKFIYHNNGQLDTLGPLENGAVIGNNQRLGYLDVTDKIDPGLILLLCRNFQNLDEIVI